MINNADTVWMIMATAMVMLMIPTLAFFYGGLVRKKNILSVLMQTMVIMAVISLQWILFGYSLAFGPDKGGIIGGLDFLGLNGVGLKPLEGQTIPHQLFMMFQMMFAVITPALIIGAFIERIKFSGFLIFTILWSIIVYCPMAHWVWGGGWLQSKFHALDFAGGTVIHITAGISALVLAILLGKRKGIATHRAPHNLPFSVLGAGFLWFGWFGFNGGSQLAADGVTVSAILNTHIAASAGALTWMILDWRLNEKPTVLGIITGLVAGLVAITPASGYVTPLASMAIGAMGSLAGFYFVSKVKERFGYDDSLDVFGVHGIAGIVGAIATGLFATSSINTSAVNINKQGLFYGDHSFNQLGAQTLTVIIAIILSIVGTYIIYKLVDKIVGMRVTTREENIGLDLTQHHETGYTLME
jgi:ammonium transporter, Amt family